MFEVWHANPPGNFLGSLCTAQKFPQGYSHVATVTCDHIGQVFGLTQHIDKDWLFARPEVVQPLTSVARSTSVGDVLVHVEDGKRIAQMVDWIGLTTLIEKDAHA